MADSIANIVIYYPRKGILSKRLNKRMLSRDLFKATKGGLKMGEKIDVHDLPGEQVRLVEEFLQFLRQKAKKRDRKVKGKEEVTFASWPLEVKGGLRRSEIYDYL
jgi:hypothetical protein